MDMRQHKASHEKIRKPIAKPSITFPDRKKKASKDKCRMAVSDDEKLQDENGHDEMTETEIEHDS